MLIKVFCVVSMLSKLPPAVCLRGVGGWGEGATGFLNKGGGSNRLPVEFPQVRTSKHNSIKENANCFLVWTHYLLSYMYEVKKMSPIIHQLEAEEHV